MYEYAVFLSRLEFSILLMAEGIEMIKCFSLPDAEHVDERQMIKAVYGLMQKRYLLMEKDGVVLAPEIAELMGAIKRSQDYLFLEPGRADQSQRIVYLGEQTVILENTGETDHEFRLCSKSRENFWKWIEDAFDIPVTEVEFNEEAVKLIQLNEISIKEMEQLQECSCESIALGVRIWMEQIQNKLGVMPCIGIRFGHSKDDKAELAMILFSGCMNLWFLWYDLGKGVIAEGESRLKLYPDSKELRMQVQDLLWRERE